MSLPFGSTRAVIVVAALTVLTGCASAPDGKPAVCDGHHRRPANPYGSVLPTLADDGAGKPAASAGAQIPPPAPGPMSAIDPQSVLPCGSHR
jgi:type IV secretion system protein VirB7